MGGGGGGGMSKNKFSVLRSAVIYCYNQKIKMRIDDNCVH